MKKDVIGTYDKITKVHIICNEKKYKLANKNKDDT